MPPTLLRFAGFFAFDPGRNEISVKIQRSLGGRRVARQDDIDGQQENTGRRS